MEGEPTPATPTPSIEAQAALDLTLANIPPTPEDPAWREEVGYLREARAQAPPPARPPATDEVTALKDESG